MTKWSLVSSPTMTRVADAHLPGCLRQQKSHFTSQDKKPLAHLVRLILPSVMLISFLITREDIRTVLFAVHCPHYYCLVKTAKNETQCEVYYVFHKKVVLN